MANRSPLDPHAAVSVLNTALAGFAFNSSDAVDGEPTRLVFTATVAALAFLILVWRQISRMIRSDQGVCWPIVTAFILPFFAAYSAGLLPKAVASGDWLPTIYGVGFIVVSAACAFLAPVLAGKFDKQPKPPQDTTD